MVDYSKFNTIEGASDSDDEKQTVDPDRAEAWLRKYDELSKEDESDSDSDDDKPTIAGVDWAKLTSDLKAHDGDLDAILWHPWQMGAPTQHNLTTSFVSFY